MKITRLLQRLAIAFVLALTAVVFLAGKEVLADTPRVEDSKVVNGKTYHVSAPALTTARYGATYTIGWSGRSYSSVLTQYTRFAGQEEWVRGFCWDPDIPVPGDYAFEAKYTIPDSDECLYLEATLHVDPGSLFPIIQTNDKEVKYDGFSHTRDIISAKSGRTLNELDTLEFSLTGEEGSYSSDLQITEAGTYTVYYRASKTYYSTSSGSQTLFIYIDKLDNYLRIDNVTADYGAPYTPSIYNPLDAIITYARSASGPFSPSIPEFTSPGSYIVYYRAEKENYYYSARSFYVTIKKPYLPAELITIVGTEGITYDGALHEPSITVDSSVTGVQVSYRFVGSNSYSTLVPSYVFWDRDLEYKVVSDQYEDVTGTIPMRMNRAHMEDKITVTGFTGNYDGQPHSISVEVQQGFTGTAVEYSTDGFDYSSANPEFTEPGAYTVYYRVVKPYYDDYTGSETVNINNCLSLDGIASVSADPITYNGDSQTVSFTTGATASVTPTYFYSWASDTGFGSELTIPASKGTGSYTAYWYASASNYTSTSTNTVIINVLQGDMSDRISVSGFTGSYDGQPHGISVSVDPSLTGVSRYFRVSGETETTDSIPEFTEPGTYTVEYTFYKSNYCNVTGYVDVVINTRSMEDNVIANDCICTYNGGEHGIDIRVVGIDGATIWYSYSENGPYTTRPITACGYGLTRVYYKVTKTGYADVTGYRDIRIIVPESLSVAAEAPKPVVTEAPKPVITAAPVAPQNEEVTVPNVAGLVPQGPAAAEPAVTVAEPEIPFILQTAKTETARDQVTISWDKVEKADRYVIYGAKVGDDLEKLAEVSADGELSFTLRDMGADAYKLYVYAYYGEHRIEKSTKMIVYADNGSKTNAVSVTFEDEKVGLKVGETKALKVTVKAAESSKKLHDTKTNPQLKFYSTNDSIVSVDKDGKLTANAKGECRIYVVALSGVSDIITVTVK